MATSGRGFGVSRRPGRGTTRPQTQDNTWTSVTNVRPARSVLDTDGPAPNQRHKVSLQFTTYCTIAMGCNKKKILLPK